MKGTRKTATAGLAFFAGIAIATSHAATSLCTSSTDLDVDEYIQDGLIAQFDGIRNAGATNAHDSAATVWKNLVDGGAHLRNSPKLQ